MVTCETLNLSRRGGGGGGGGGGGYTGNRYPLRARVRNTWDYWSDRLDIKRLRHPHRQKQELLLTLKQEIVAAPLPPSASARRDLLGITRQQPLIACEINMAAAINRGN